MGGLKHHDHWWPGGLAANILQCSEAHIEWLAREGKIDKFVRDGVPVYDPDDVELIQQEVEQGELWSQVLSVITKQISSVEYEACFSVARLEQLDSRNKVLTVTMPGERLRSRLIDKHSDIIDNALSKAGLGGYRVSFVCEGSYELGWTAEAFLKRNIQPKEALVEGLLHTRDLTTFVGRRRHGKTTFLINMAVALALAETGFIGHRIVRPARSLLLLLEDDPGELQDKVGKVLGGGDPQGRIKLATREDFYEKGIPIDVNNSRFWEAIDRMAQEHCPDWIAFDNYAHIVGGAFNDSKVAHKFLTELYYSVAKKHNAGVIIATHPRKHDLRHLVKLENQDDPELFYEMAIGSSHLINSTGNLWGIERNKGKDYAVFHGGRQRAEGQEEFTLIQMDDNNRLTVLSGTNRALGLCLTTEARGKAWSVLPGSFRYSEGEKLVKPYLRSSKSYNDFLNALKRHELVKKGSGGKYHKWEAQVKGANLRAALT